MSALVEKFYRWLIALGSALRSPLLLAVRLFWGWQFFLTGKGKLMDLAKPTQFFESLGIPFPHAQAVLVGSVECFGGLLLLIGLATRLISVPLMILLTVAYLTADIDRVRAIFSDPDKFVTADEFLFLFAVVIIFVFGPGAFSLDALIGKYFKRHDGEGEPIEFAPDGQIRRRYDQPAFLSGRCFPFAKRYAPSQWKFERACAHPGAFVRRERPGCSPKARSDGVHDLVERVQPRKILRSFAKILLPSKRPFIELATRAPQAIQSNPFFILKPPSLFISARAFTAWRLLLCRFSLR